MAAFWILQGLNTLQYAALLFLISAGLSVSFGLMGFVNLAHGALYMLGAYIGIWVAGQHGFWTGMIAAPLAVGAIGGALYLALLHRVARLGPMPQVLVSFGLVFILTEITRILWGDIPLGLELPALLAGRIPLPGAAYPHYRLFVIALGFGLALVLWLCVNRTALGASLRASVENRDMARAIGIDTDRLLLLVFTLGSALAGLGGVIAAPITAANTGMAISILVPALIVTVIGGTGSISGAIVGALIVAAVEVLGAAFLPRAGGVLVYAMLIAALIWRPEGLFQARAVR